MNFTYQTKARDYWDRARRRAFWTNLLGALDGSTSQAELGLMNFDAVSQRLRLKNAIYRGVQNIPLDRIVGSVGRYQDFTGAFLPVSEDMSGRWQRVATQYLNPVSQGVPPIEVFKVGDSYFVRDGNHRVSVVHQLGLPDIEAYVWEYPQPVEGLGDEADIDTLLLEAERREFLEQTYLDELRPGHNIRLTAPGGYLDMLGQIAHYQHVLSKIDGEPMPYEDAVTAWYDMVYETVVQIITEQGVMEQFPDRTPADFFVWTMRYKPRLEEQMQRRVSYDTVAAKIPREHRVGLLRRLWHGAVRALLRRVADRENL
ncbi:MAG: hypothetical protein JW910_11260 [Anaerolineae bacterium]|nr:hypothetical protein [Anaerolineae bacterium]